MASQVKELLAQPSEVVAPRLLGCLLERELEDGQKIVGKIVETEAYDQADVASHSYRGDTPRTHVMFGEPGHLYVYFTYGMHYCCNVVTGPKGHGAAVLIRAVEPIAGVKIMMQNRGGKRAYELTNGPAKTCQAFGIDKTWNGHDLQLSPLKLLIRPAVRQENVIQTTRIGISNGQETPWRFYLKDNKFVSRPL